MKAISVRDDDEHSLVWDETPTPDVDARDVLVDVHATAVNRADLLQRRGGYPPPEGASDILGLEIAGTVAEVGNDVDDWHTGDRVCALLAGGGYAEYASVHADMLLPVPDGMDLEAAAGIPEVFYTAYLNLVVEGDMTSDDLVLIHAGASGVGTAAIQIATHRGATVWSTASGGKLPVLRELGAERAIDRHDESFAEVVQTELDGRDGVDLILDPVGADYLSDNIDSLSTDGRLILIGLLGGASTDISLANVLTRRLRIIGSVLRSRPIGEKIKLTDRIRRDIWPHLESGDIEPIIDRVLPIQRAEEAHSLLERNQTAGKVILTVN